jgi:hypothetical protein
MGWAGESAGSVRKIIHKVSAHGFTGVPIDRSSSMGWESCHYAAKNAGFSPCGKVFSSSASPQRLKPNQFERFFGTAEAVPWRILPSIKEVPKLN